MKDGNQLKLSSQICFPMYSVSRLITKLYKPYLDELGITYPQYLVLLVLWENDNQSVNDISKKLLLNSNTISPLLKRMEKLKLIQRTRSSEDERSVLVELTDRGSEMKNNALPIPEKLMNELIAKDIRFEDIIKLKDLLCNWMTVLSEERDLN